MSRSRRMAAALAVLAVPLLTGLPAARADGGAYLWFERTYNYPGTEAEGYASVYLPQEKRGILDRGPFYLYVLTGKQPITEDEPIPAGAIRLGAFAIERDRKWFNFEVGFTVPELAGGFYTVMVCNDPCTVAGFREPLIGVLPIVATAREEQLLRQQGRLHGRIGHLHRELRKSQKAIEELEGIADLRSTERTTLLSEVSDLRSRIERLRIRPDGRARPLVSPASAWVVGAALLALGFMVLVRRKRRRPPMADGGPVASDGTPPLAAREWHALDDAERERAGTR